MNIVSFDILKQPMNWALVLFVMTLLLFTTYLTSKVFPNE